MKDKLVFFLMAVPLVAALIVHGSTKPTPTPTKVTKIEVATREVRSIDIAVTIPAEYVGCRAIPRIMEDGEESWTPLMSQSWDITEAETQEPHHITGNYVHDGRKHYIQLQILGGEDSPTTIDMGSLE